MKKPIKLAAAVAIAIGFAFAVPNVKEKKQITIVLDAAHGGKDYGSSYSGFTEKEIAAAVSEKIQELNADVEVVVYETRDGDTFVSLEDRVNVTNNVKPDLMLSLHTNFEKKGEKSGVELFFNDENIYREQSKQYADKLAGAFAAKEYTIAVKSAPYYVLKKSEAPAITIEMGYLSNDADRGYLTTSAGQEAVARVIVDFIQTLK